MTLGAARVIAEKAGFLDTLLITVGSGFAPLDSIRFALPSGALMIGDGMPANLLGYFSDAAGSGAYVLDTLAEFDYDAGVLQIRNGVITATGSSDSTNVTALFAGQRCTLQVRTASVPSFVRRINFQPKGDPVTSIQGWSLDSGTVYSPGIGYGWLTAGTAGEHTPLITNHFRATNAGNSPGDYRVDCPDGNYLIRLCNSQNPWTKPGIVRTGNDTLILNPQAHAESGVTSEGQIWLADRRITVTGGAGLSLFVYGRICYLVLISDDGADLNLAAKDGNYVPGPLYTQQEGPGTPQRFSLLRRPAACPNPFNPTTTVRFSLPSGVSADYILYNIHGSRITSEHLIREQTIRMREVVLNLHQTNGKGIASGTYFGRLVCSDGKRYVHSLVLMK